MIRTVHRTDFLRAGIAMILLLLFFLLAANADDAAAVTAERLRLCTDTLIPSLFGCMAAANLLIASGTAAWLGTRLRRIARLLRISPEVLTVFLVSQIAGYPVGTLLLCQMVKANRLSPDMANRYACICFGGGPAFLVGFAGCRLFGNRVIGWLMLCGCVLSNLILLLLLPNKEMTVLDEKPFAIRLTAHSLPDAVSGAMRSLTAICGMVMLFGLLTLLCEQIGLIAGLVRLGSNLGLSAQTVRAWTAALCDVTQLPMLFECGLSYRMLTALSAALLSFGGICVQLQCTALSGTQLRLRNLFLFRLVAGGLTFLIVFALSGMLGDSEAAQVFRHSATVSHTGSPLPAFLIFCTGFPFLIKKD